MNQHEELLVKKCEQVMELMNENNALQEALKRANKTIDSLRREESISRSWESEVCRLSKLSEELVDEKGVLEKKIEEQAFRTESLWQKVHLNCLLQARMLHSKRQANVYKDEVISLNVENTSLSADVQEMERTRKEIREVIYDISF